MFSRKRPKLQNHVGSLIGVGTQINGDIAFNGSLRIDGEVKGNISTPNTTNGTVVLGQQARVEGKLIAPHLLINGTVIGPTISTESMELQLHARVTGNLYYKTIVMHPGAVVDGQLVHCISNNNSGELELVYGTLNLQGAAAKKTVSAQS